MSRERVAAPHAVADEKRRKSLRATLRELRKFQKSLLEARDGKPIPSSVPDLDEIREGR